MWRCTHFLFEHPYQWLAQMSVRQSANQLKQHLFCFVMQKGRDLKWSRSRGMFWIFQDKEHLGLYFVDPEAFSLRDNEKTEMSSPHLVCLRPILVILGLCCFWIAFFSWRNVSADGCKPRPKLQCCWYKLAKFFKIGPLLSSLLMDNDCFIADEISIWDKFHAYAFW